MARCAASNSARLAANSFRSSLDCVRAKRMARLCTSLTSRSLCARSADKSALLCSGLRMGVDVGVC